MWCTAALVWLGRFSEKSDYSGYLGKAPIMGIWIFAFLLLKAVEQIEISIRGYENCHEWYVHAWSTACHSHDDQICEFYEQMGIYAYLNDFFEISFIHAWIPIGS